MLSVESINKRSQRLVAALLTASSLTHGARLAVYAPDTDVLAAAFGVAYGAVGLLLVRGSRSGLWLALTLPSVGGIFGVWRFMVVHRNPFCVLHIAIDVVVVALCGYMVWRGRGARRTAD